MDKIEKIAFIVNKKEHILECTRSAQGLAIENFEVGLFIINAEIESGDSSGDYADRFEMIDDLEGSIISNVRNNCELFSLIRYQALNNISSELKKYDLIIPYSAGTTL